MALFEIVFKLPGGSDESALTSAVKAAGFGDAKTREKDLEGVFGVIVQHQGSKFETGAILAEGILPHLPVGSSYLSHVMSASIQEMSDDEIGLLLAEIENCKYGQSTR